MTGLSGTLTLGVALELGQPAARSGGAVLGALLTLSAGLRLGFALALALGLALLLGLGLALTLLLSLPLAAK